MRSARLSRAGGETETQVCFAVKELHRRCLCEVGKSLAKQNKLPLITVDQGETLGEWLGICKYD
jgi:hypothetical protein